MTDLYLIAHKVRGEAAFDVASRMECPMCTCEAYRQMCCVECDSTGYWWIIPTSGHRAYPVDVVPFDELRHFEFPLLNRPLPVMDTVPDHYPHRAEPNRPKLDISALIPKKPSAPIRRRA